MQEQLQTEMGAECSLARALWKQPHFPWPLGEKEGPASGVFWFQRSVFYWPGPMSYAEAVLQLDVRLYHSLQKASFPQFLVNNSLVSDNFHLQAFIMVAREWRMCTRVLYVCACIFVYIYMCGLFNHFYCFLHHKLSICDSMSGSVYLEVHPKWLIIQWCTVLSSHKPDLLREAECTCIVCKLISRKQSLHIN